MANSNWSKKKGEEGRTRVLETSLVREGGLLRVMYASPQNGGIRLLDLLQPSHTFHAGDRRWRETGIVGEGRLRFEYVSRPFF